MFSFNSIFSGQLDSRLFVQMMFKASGRYASFTPSAIQLGDYGFVDRDSGEFIREGNVLKLHPELASEFANPHETPAGVCVFKQSYRHSTYKDLNVDASLADVVDAKVKVGWSYDKVRFCALVLIDPITVEIPYEGELCRVLLEDERLQRKAVVTQLVKCTTYAILLTNGDKGEAYAGFHAGLPIPVTVPLTVGGGAKVGWKTDCVNGVWNTGIYKPGVYRYTPLCTLRNIKKKAWTNLRGVSRVAVPPPQVLPDYYPPWNDLNPDGTEIPDEEDGESNYGDDDEEGEEEEAEEEN